MSTPHRSDLEAAHARIAALEKESAERGAELVALHSLATDGDSSISKALEHDARARALKLADRSHGRALSRIVARPGGQSFSTCIEKLTMELGTRKLSQSAAEVAWQVKHDGIDFKLTCSDVGGSMLVTADSPGPNTVAGVVAFAASSGFLYLTTLSLLALPPILISLAVSSAALYLWNRREEDALRSLIDRVCELSEGQPVVHSPVARNIGQGSPGQFALPQIASSGELAPEVREPSA